MAQKIDGDLKRFCNGTLTCFINGNSKKVYKYYPREDCEALSLNELLKTMGDPTYHTAIVIFRDYYDGVIYEYGNHGNFWTKIGDINGLHY